MRRLAPKKREPEEAAPEFPMRLNRYLAIRGFSTRRGADQLIEDGKVRVNGRPAKIGQKIKASDKVELEGFNPAKPIYIAYSKPKGIVTHTPQEGETSISDVLKFKERLFPLGRLDKNSEGLIILTNDGRATDRLLNPEHEHEKEYLVKVNKPIDGNLRRLMEKGVYIEGYRTKPAKFEQTSEKAFHLTLVEGKKHQIRRMVTAIGFEVMSLKRLRIMNVKLGNLHSGKHREIKGKELVIFLENLGLAES